jgi:hypothetical protein
MVGRHPRRWVMLAFAGEDEKIMRIYKYLLVMAIITLLAGSGCSLLGQPTVLTPEIPTAKPAAEDIPAVQRETAEPESGVPEGTEMKATLTVKQGLVEVRHTGETGYTAVAGTTLLGNGDMVRTGDDGIAVVVFLENTETTLFENAELVINEFTVTGDDTYTIKLQQIAGLIFNRANFSNKNSQHQLSTPYAVAAVRGTGYWSDLHVGEGFVRFAVVAGTVVITYFDADGVEHTIILEADFAPGKIQAIQINANGEVIEIVFDLYCGDGICDAYTGETEITCPDDC